MEGIGLKWDRAADTESVGPVKGKPNFLRSCDFEFLRKPVVGPVSVEWLVGIILPFDKIWHYEA